MRSKYVLIGLVGIVVGVLLASVAVVLAGQIDSPEAPTHADAQMYTLEQIYDRLDTGAETAKMTTFTEPSSGPTAGTGHTLDEVMAEAPAVDDTNGAGVADVSSGKTAWGLTSGAWGVITGTGTIATYAAVVPKTGVTVTIATGDDGDLEKGVAWPNPRFTKSSGTVTDNLTGLIWLQDANCISTQHATYNFDNDVTAGDGRVTWQHALDFVAGINAGTYSNCGAGHTDWRLPNVNELLSLIHYGVYDPSVPDTAGTGRWTADTPFDGVQSYVYWSSTTSAYHTGYAWYVYLYDGLVNYDSKAHDFYVWPVRGGQ
ncbi:MAG: DUF1566 domain-containing protein [Chloroflexi bacterium]|nr:DUF1566 domain-containing protein [Chloroflexota bacterium]